ncbi:toll/interleukin-1 receptor domain-containing protein [Lentzea sp. NPDC006480]|uniref:toll/interleukin-1 receptor domain-containing protein n=1 Tax=Lentzea sp. NPDC006480 TaxID=3157176 RepID=UPI0033B9C781
MAHDERWDFFIAYASADRVAANELYDLLSPPFRVFLDSRALLPGDDWGRRLPAAQSLSSVTLVLISSRTGDAVYQVEEIATAIELARRAGDLHRVVPILLDEREGEAELPYGLRGKQSISVTEAGGLAGVATRLKTTLRQRMAMSADEIQRRYEDRTAVERAVRLVPRDGFDRDGRLGSPERDYVFVGDHDEQRHRTLRQILSNLWIGDAFERVENSNEPWLALTFDVGELNRRKLDLMPGTWKAAFRILSDPRRAARFEATPEELARLGRPPRDYYSADQLRWYHSCNDYSPQRPARFLREALGIEWLCFGGNGITERAPATDGIPSRVFFVRNLPLPGITYRVQDLGVPDDGVVLD